MAKAEEFNTGDVVQLVSRGPEMSVKTQHSGGEYNCQWFAGKKLEDGWFPGASLKLIKKRGE
ncbi:MULTISPECIES: YodC family protein [unclassified Caballeronia]|uniref:YodC family protein n=1 Tax=unclassified Caballeronia TaxID=2646786 RepID=UPI0020287CA3|nr:MULTISPECIES: DUF2158 domain-containing protein [unclassified Caballeronia]